MQYAGIDVSADTVDVSLQDASGLREERFPNDAKGHRALVAMLSRSAPVRVALEPTSTYSLDLTATLHEAPGVEVMVVNPRKAAHFAKAHGRGKTDKGDARVLRHYVASTTFVAWKPTSEEASRLRQLS
jgi:transposase